MKHSRGPWTVSVLRGFVRDWEGKNVCQMWDKFENDFDNWKSNALLISTSPLGLELAEMVIDYGTERHYYVVPGNDGMVYVNREFINELDRKARELKRMAEGK